MGETRERCKSESYTWRLAGWPLWSTYHWIHVPVQMVGRVRAKGTLLRAPYVFCLIAPYCVMHSWFIIEWILLTWANAFAAALVYEEKGNANPLFYITVLVKFQESLFVTIDSILFLKTLQGLWWSMHDLHFLLVSNLCYWNQPPNCEKNAPPLC